MRQIPSEGEFCGIDCPERHHNFCQLYGTDLEVSSQRGNWKCLPQCLSDRPQVLTEEERGDIFHAGMRSGYDNALELASEGKEAKPCPTCHFKDDHDIDCPDKEAKP